MGAPVPFVHDSMDLQNGRSARALADSSRVAVASHRMKTTCLPSHVGVLSYVRPFHRSLFAPGCSSVILKLKAIAFFIYAETFFLCYVASLYPLGVASGGNPSVERQACHSSSTFSAGLSWYWHL